MSNNLLEFSQKLSQKVSYDRSMEEKRLAGHGIYEAIPTYLDTYAEIVKFYLAYQSATPGVNYLSNPQRTLITLDEEDLNYFKNKYLPKMEDEYQSNLAELSSKYGKV